LNGSFLKALFYGTLSLSLLFLTGCPKSKPSGSNGGSGGPPEVTSSENVVRLGGAGAGISAPGSLNIQIPIRIDEGYHINANPASYSYLIATEVTAKKVEGLEVGKPVYPPAVKKKFQFADQPLAVYEGNVNVTLPLTAHFTGTKSLPISVRVQACDQEKCFPPATLHATYPITVDAK
jgi:Disulphide bond corrector protein DsbC